MRRMFYGSPYARSERDIERANDRIATCLSKQAADAKAWRQGVEKINGNVRK